MGEGAEAEVGVGIDASTTHVDTPAAYTPANVASPPTLPVKPPTMSAVPRESMVTTAVNFLQNAKVRQSPFSQRRMFLEKKGLTTEEIEIAIQRSGTAGDENMVMSAPGGQSNVGMMAAQPGTGAVIPASPMSAWSKARDYCATAIVVGGVAFAIYKLYKQYILPWLYGPSQQEKQLEAIEKSVQELKTSMAETIKSLQESQTELLSKLENNMYRTPGGDVGNQISGVKDDIKSLKGLLLSRKQFPTAPVAAPVVPSWQLASCEKSSETIEKQQPPIEQSPVSLTTPSRPPSEAAPVSAVSPPITADVTVSEPAVIHPITADVTVSEPANPSTQTTSLPVQLSEPELEVLASGLENLSAADTQTVIVKNEGADSTSQSQNTEETKATDRDDLGD